MRFFFKSIIISCHPHFWNAHNFCHHLFTNTPDCICNFAFIATIAATAASKDLLERRFFVLFLILTQWALILFYFWIDARLYYTFTFYKRERHSESHTNMTFSFHKSFSKIYSSSDSEKRTTNKGKILRRRRRFFFEISDFVDKSHKLVRHDKWFESK